MKDYYTLTKPGIVYGNALTVIAGFFLASRSGIDYELLLITVFGISLIIASGCVFNNYIDRDIDALMERTKSRPLVRGVIKNKHALVFGTTLGLVGIYILGVYTNEITVLVSIIGFFVYVVLYSMLYKRTTVHGALIGSISGAVPLVVGYLAVNGVIDSGAIILFFILALWQMPHSFAISIRRLDDYNKAGIPVLPAKKGIQITKIQILIYTVLFVIATLLLTPYGYMGWLYFLVMSFIGVVWVLISLRGLYDTTISNTKWARQVFLFSLIVLVVFCTVVIYERVMF